MNLPSCYFGAPTKYKDPAMMNIDGVEVDLINRIVKCTKPAVIHGYAFIGPWTITAAENVHYKVQYCLFDPYCLSGYLFDPSPVSLPVAAAMGTTAVLIHNPSVTRRQLFGGGTEGG